MRTRPAHALRPFCLAVTALSREGSVALRDGHDGRISTTAASTLSFLRAVSAPSSTMFKGARALHCSASCRELRGKEQRWELPWGNSGKQGNDRPQKTLTRTLELLPGLDDDLTGSDTFRIMSFNILAQGMALSKQFTYVPKGQLRKGVRWPRVRDEVCRYGADIICLQECDSFKQILKSLNDADWGESQRSPRFDGVFKQRSGSESSHGVAIVFDTQVFRLVDSGSCEYGKSLYHGVGTFALLQDRRRSKSGRPIPSDDGNVNGGRGELETSTGEEGCRERLIGARRSNGGGLDDEASGMVCVATTHLYWHPEGEGVRLAQAEALLEEVEAFLRERYGDEYSTIPVVLAGDLNTLPGVDVYSLLSTGHYQGGTPEQFEAGRKARAAARMRRRIEEARQAETNSAISASKLEEIPRFSAEGHTHSGVEGTDTSQVIQKSRSRNTTLAAPVPAVDAPVSAASVGIGSPSGDPAKEPMSQPPTQCEEGSGVKAEDERSGVANRVMNGIGKEDDGRQDVQAHDARRVYRQGFKGFLSAYGAYSSVFASQLCDSAISSVEASLCQSTGMQTLGHVRLGQRDAFSKDDCGLRGNGVSLTDADVLGGTKNGRKSAEDGHDRLRGEPALTTCTDKFAGTIDYIWYTPQLRTRALLDLPSLNQAMQGGGLPTMAYPSDHLSIMAELEWRSLEVESGQGKE